MAMIPENFIGINLKQDDIACRGIHLQTEKGCLTRIIYGSLGLEVIKAMHHSIAHLAAAGLDLIVDDLIPEAFLKNYLQTINHERVYLVGVRCPLAEVEKREQLRKDRIKGTARLEHEWVHQPGIYDLELHTQQQSAQECASQLLNFIFQEKPFTAFDQLRQKYNQPYLLPDHLEFGVSPHFKN